MNRVIYWDGAPTPPVASGGAAIRTGPTVTIIRSFRGPQ
jgi:hypothetical protein